MGVFIHTHTHAHSRTHARVNAHIHAHLHTYTHIHARAHTHTHTFCVTPADTAVDLSSGSVSCRLIQVTPQTIGATEINGRAELERPAARTCILYGQSVPRQHVLHMPFMPHTLIPHPLSRFLSLVQIQTHTPYDTNCSFVHAPICTRRLVPLPALAWPILYTHPVRADFRVTLFTSVHRGRERDRGRDRERGGEREREKQG